MVALLGACGQVGPELQLMIEEIDRRHALCVTSAEDVQYFIKHGAERLIDTPHVRDSSGSRELEEQIDELRDEMLTVCENYKQAAREYSQLAAQVHDLGPNHPDGAEALRISTSRFDAVLKHYNAAVAKLAELLSKEHL